MAYRSNKAFTPLETIVKQDRERMSLTGFTLIEVLITAAILSVAITFVFRSFAATLAAARFSQNITFACYLAGDKISQIEEDQRGSAVPLSSERGTEEAGARQFNWGYELNKAEESELIELKFDVSWPEGRREKEYTITFLADLLPAK